MEHKNNKHYIKVIIKNFIAVIFIITNIGLIQAQYTAIPDPCFELYLVQQGIDSEGTTDLQVLTSDIENITYLQLFAPCQVYDLTGIQDFVSLEILDLAFLNLSEIDLSNNLALKKLYVEDNNLTSLDISNNINLEILYCSSNYLENLDISNNPALRILSCPNNQINTFVSNNNNNLKRLEVSFNNITTIDPTELYGLESFGCGHNLITSLDLSQNVNLTQLGCGNNDYLEYVDLRNGNNVNMIDFSILNSPNLSCVFVDDAQYSQENWLNIDSNSTFVETEEECSTLTINDSTINNIYIYPNPVENVLFMENIDNIKTIEIYSILGKRVLTTNAINNQIDLSNFKKGIWFLKIEYEGVSIIKKI